jgi:hypothetical protein
MLALLAFGATVALRGESSPPPIDDVHPTTWTTYEVCSDAYNSELQTSWRTLVPSKHDRELAILENCLETTSGWVGDLAYRDGDVVSLRVGRFWYQRSAALQSCLEKQSRYGYLCGGMVDALVPPAHIVWHVPPTGD